MVSRFLYNRNLHMSEFFCTFAPDYVRELYYRRAGPV